MTRDEKADSDSVKRQNRRLVLEALRQSGAQARTDLGRITGLSLATISSISSQLLAEGLIEPSGGTEPSAKNRRGRPLTLLDLNPAAAFVMAVKLSIDGAELVLADFRGQVRHRQALPLTTYDADGDRIGGAVAREIRAFLAARGISPSSVRRMTVAVQGLADSQKGQVTWSPAFSCRNIPIAEPIETELGIPVSMGNDANMIAEAITSEGRSGRGTTLVIFVGHGVGMGLIIDGAVFHGDTGAAAEFGHMNHMPHGALCRCGRMGCVEAYAADYGILRAARGGTGREPAPRNAIPDATMLSLEGAARAGNATAQTAFASAGEALGFGIARLIAVLNPSRIVLAGSGTRAMPLMAPALHQAITDGVVAELRRGIGIEVIPLETDMIVKGALTSALRHLDREVFAPGSGGEPGLPRPAAAPLQQVLNGG